MDRNKLLAIVAQLEKSWIAVLDEIKFQGLQAPEYLHAKADSLKAQIKSYKDTLGIK